jgi:ABC-type transport system involved in multi-copper enzyme maturation permease subunit
MMRIIRSEWTKFLRPGQLLGSWGTMAGFVLLLTVLLLSNAKAGDVASPADQGQRGPPSLSFSQFEVPAGGIFTFQATGQLLGIITLVIAAANVATEYSAGTLKMLLVREPRRPLLLGGKLVALALFSAAGITLALVLSVGVSAAIAAARGIETSAWWTGDGWSAIGQAYANVVLASWVWLLLGAMLAVVFRSGFPAIGVGIAYPILVEPLLSLVAADAVKYMPGRVLQTLVAGHTGQAFGDTSASLSYASAAVLAGAYALAFLAISVYAMSQRDVA